MDLGAIQAGFSIEYAIDSELIAVETYKANIGNHIVCGDVGDCNLQSLGKNLDLLIGGPPCQGFSSAGPKRIHDPRNKLWEEYLRFVKQLRPAICILENVMGFRRELPEFIASLEKNTAGAYRVFHRPIIAQFYGVPQWRHRLFVVCVRKDIGDTFVWPKSDVAEKYDFNLWQPGLVTLQDALQDLGPPSKEASDKLDHTCIPLNEVDGEIASHIPNGGSLKDIPDRYLPAPYKGRARGKKGWTWYYRKPRPHLPGRSVIASTRPNYATILAPDVNYLRIGSDWKWEPVDAGPHTSKSGLYTSPTPQRRLTIRECARLQTFPDSFLFKGTLMQKHKMIGNAVPIEFARRLCCAAAHLIEHGDEVADRSAQGELF